jgi:hypothetical protein
VEETGKAAVMLLSNFRHAVPRFNKYPGAVEWANCVFLWVNICIPGGGGSQYSNAFSAEGRHMMWFGGSKMHKGRVGYCSCIVVQSMHSLQCSNCNWSSVTNPFIDSKVIKRLVAMNSSVSGDCCMLFVRFEGAPYACLGESPCQTHQSH